MAQVLSDLFIPGSGCGDVDIAFDGVDLIARYELRQHGRDRIGRLIFLGVAAFRFRKEMLSRGFVTAAYDRLVAIDTSAWRTEVENWAPSGMKLSQVRHFAVFFSSNGYLEVLARDVEVAEPVDEPANGR